MWSTWLGRSWQIETQDTSGEDADLEQDNANAGCDDDCHGGADNIVIKNIQASIAVGIT